MTVSPAKPPKPLLPVLIKLAFKPEDNSPLIAFRIVFGLLLCYHVLSQVLSDYVYKVYIKPPFTFNFIGFDFLQPLPGSGMYFYFALMALLAFMVAIGSWYRLAITGFTILWAGIYLMQKSYYNNHYYFILLLCFLMIFVPANRDYSIDVKRKAVEKNLSCPAIIRWMFIIQVAIVYFYAGIAKVNPDWLSGRIIQILFISTGTENVLGPVAHHHYFHLLISYAGILFDLLVVPFLLWRKTRVLMIILACLFHIFNSVAFSIGIFPYLSICLMLFFVNPATVQLLIFKNRLPLGLPENKDNTTAKKSWIIYGCALYLLIQVILPLRHVLYPGNVAWSEEGHRLSWQMMARGKRGKVKFKVVHKMSGKQWVVDPAKDFSADHVKWIATLPDIMWQYAQWLKLDFASKGFKNVEVYSISSVSLNGYRARPLADTTVNLAAVKWHPFKHSKWIMPYNDK